MFHIPIAPHKPKYITIAPHHITLTVGQHAFQYYICNFPTGCTQITNHGWPWHICCYIAVIRCIVWWPKYESDNPVQNPDPVARAPVERFASETIQAHIFIYITMMDDILCWWSHINWNAHIYTDSRNPTRRWNFNLSSPFSWNNAALCWIQFTWSVIWMRSSHHSILM